MLWSMSARATAIFACPLTQRSLHTRFVVFRRPFSTLPNARNPAARASVVRAAKGCATW